MAANTNKGFGLLFEMGCGKTRTAIAIAGAAYEKGAIQRVLVIAPTSVVSVWPKEIAEVADFKVTCKALLGTKQQRIRMIEDLQAFPFKALKVAVINYESTWRDGLFEKLQEYDADLIICDESQRIKTHDAEQSKAIHKLGDQARYKLILSGTPVQNDAIDIWSQYRFLDASIFGRNFYQFRNRYAIMGGFNRKQIVGYKDLDGLIRKEHSIAFRITKEEAIDLPEQTFIKRKVQLGKKEKDLYNQIKRSSYAELSNGDKITATTVLTRLLRLQQLAGGFLVTDDSDKPELVNTAKLDALQDIIEDYVLGAGKKLVIFARFIPEVTAIMKMIDKTFQKTRNIETSRTRHFPHHRYLIVQELHRDDRVLDQVAFNQFLLDLVGQLHTRKPFDMHLSEDREIDIPVRIHQITQHALLSVHDTPRRAQLVSHHRHVKRQSQLRLLTIHHDRQQVVTMDNHLVLLFDLLLLVRFHVLQVQDFLRRSTGGKQYRHVHHYQLQILHHH